MVLLEFHQKSSEAYSLPPFGIQHAFTSFLLTIKMKCTEGWILFTPCLNKTQTEMVASSSTYDGRQTEELLAFEYLPSARHSEGLSH